MLALFSNYDRNGDGINEINLMKLLPFENPINGISKENKLLVVLVESRLFSRIINSFYSSTDLMQRLKQFREDLKREGYETLFIETDCYKGPNFQDGQVVLAIRDFFKKVKTEFPNFQGSILIGDFPQAKIVRRWMWKMTASVSSPLLMLGHKYTSGEYLWIYPHIVVHSADIVLADLKGNWDSLYIQGTHDIEHIKALPGAKTLTEGWPKDNQVFESCYFFEEMIQFRDFFWLRDDDYEKIPGTSPFDSLRIRIAQRHPELCYEDRQQANPSARPDVFISRINAKHAGVNPDPNYIDNHGNHFLDASGKPQEIEANAWVDTGAGSWRQDPNLERTLLIEYFDRNHFFRIGRFSTFTFQKGVVACGFGTDRVDDMYSMAMPVFTATRNVPDASLLDYVNWLKEKIIARGIDAHATSMSTEFNNNYKLQDLERAVGGHPWRWVRERAGNKYKPSLSGIGKDANTHIHRTLWENKLLKKNPPSFFIHTGCDSTSPLNCDRFSYADDRYGIFQNAESILFYLEGLVYCGRSKTYYDAPTEFGLGLNSSENPNFGGGWNAYFEYISRSDHFAADLREFNTASNKMSYHWGLLGDWTIRLKYWQKWRQHSGLAQDIGVGADGSVWCISCFLAAGGFQIAKYNKKDKTWIILQEAGIRIAVDPQGNPWCVDSNGDIFYKNNPNWQRMPGKAKDIGIGADGSVWSVGTDSAISKWDQVNRVWNKVPGHAQRIAVDPKGNPWVTNNVHDIFCWEANNWKQIPGKAEDIGIGADGSVWVIGLNKSIHSWTGEEWVQAQGSGTQISVGSNGLAWIVGDDNCIFEAITGPGLAWNKRPGWANELSIGADGTVWVLGHDEVAGGYSIHRWNRIKNQWNTVAGGAVRIAVDPNGKAWVINNEKKIFQQKGDVWEQIAGWATDIAIGADGTVFVLGHDQVGGGYSVNKWDAKIKKWLCIPGGGVRIAVDPQGLPWVVNSDHKIFRWRSNQWDKLPGWAQDIAIGKDGVIWIVGTGVYDEGYDLYLWDDMAKDWEKVYFCTGTRIAVDHHNKPWVIKKDKSIWQGI